MLVYCVESRDSARFYYTLVWFFFIPTVHKHQAKTNQRQKPLTGLGVLATCWSSSIKVLRFIPRKCCKSNQNKKKCVDGAPVHSSVKESTALETQRKHRRSGVLVSCVFSSVCVCVRVCGCAGLAGILRFSETLGLYLPNNKLQK